MKRLGLVFLSIVLLLVVAACGKGADNGNTQQNGQTQEHEHQGGLEHYTVDFTGAQDVVPTGEFMKYTVTVKDDAGQAATVDKVYLFMNMEGMHHPTEGTMKEVDKGVYELELPLAMAGEWYAEVTLTLNDEEHTFGKFHQQAEGKKIMMYMKGYNADLGKPYE